MKHAKKKKTLGLFVGKFKPLHDGHKFLIKEAAKENDITVICIGSAQDKGGPFGIERRYALINEFIEILKAKRKLKKREIRIVCLPNINSDKEWPKYLKKRCDITDNTENTLYTADKDLPAAYLGAMKKLGFKIKILEKKSFKFQDPNGKNHIVKSSTEIRKILGIELKSERKWSDFGKK